MRKSWMIRKDQEGVSPVIATILMVAITVVLAAVLYAVVTSIVPPEPDTHMIGLVKYDRGKNWELSVSRVSSNLPLTQATLTIKDGDGLIKGQMAAVPFSKLTTDHWDTYKVLYQKLNATDVYVEAGASLLIDKATYDTDYRYEIMDGSGIIASGTL